MRLLCPAKINLHLRVGRRRAAEGFHPLLTWMATVGLFDTLTMEAATARPPTGGGTPATGGDRPRAAVSHLSGNAQPGIHRPGTARHADEDPPSGRERASAARILLLSSDPPGLPTDESNLVVRAAEAFADAIADGGAGDVATGATVRSRGDVRADAGSGSASLPATADEPTHRGAGGPQPLRHREGLAAPGSRGDVGAVPATPGVREGVDALSGAPRTTGQRPARFGGEAERAGAMIARVAAVLEKRIPLGAGLGGGSSDAARTLAGLNHLWQMSWPVERLAQVAATLGSDVPFFLHGPSSICTGRGEIVRPIARPAVARWAVLVLPDVHMPTPAVYRRFDELGLGFDDELAREPDWEKWTALPAKDLLPGLVNDLERPAFELKRELGELRGDVELKLARPVRMSGSGSSLFTLYDECGEAEAAASGISELFAVRATAVEVAPVGAKDDLNGTAPPA